MSLYAELGGEQAIGFALDRFYEKVLADQRVSGFFEDVDVERLKVRQGAFLAMAFGGPDHYDGPGLRAAHHLPRRRGLDEEGFEAFMDLFRETLEELGVGEEGIGRVMEIAYGGKDEVLDR